jgi:hypothetical protein
MAHLTRFLLQDHARINRAFDGYMRSPTSLDQALVACAEFEVHSAIEEELVYPVLREEVDAREADAAEDEHAEAKQLIAEIQNLEPGDEELPDLMQDLMEAVAAHIDHEETEIIPQVQTALGTRVWDLGREAFGMRQELLGQGERPAHSPKALPNTGWSKGLVSNAGW